MKLNELIEKRGKALADARALHEQAKKEERDLKPEEEQRYDAFMAEYDSLDKQIQREVRLQAEENKPEVERRSGREDAERRGDGRPEPEGPGTPEFISYRDMQIPTAGMPFAAPVYAEGFRSYLNGRSLTEEARKIYEQRALQADSDILGGFIVAPPQMAVGLLKAVDDQVYIRRKAKVIPIGMSSSLGVPSLDADPADSDWTAEIATGSEDSTMAFGKRELKPKPLAKRIKVSNKLMRAAVLSPEMLVRDRLAYKFAVSEEKGFLTGDGTQEPLGVFTASNDGISTSRDVSTGNTTTAFTVDGLKEAKYSLKDGYWANASWIFHRDAVKMLAKLKDGEGRYLWQDSIVAGEPSQVLSFPVSMSEYAPNTFTTGLYVGILGDFSYYWIADALDLQIQRLTELYAETNQTGFIGRLETDGMPVLGAAFARVKLA